MIIIKTKIKNVWKKLTIHLAIWSKNLSMELILSALRRNYINPGEEQICPTPPSKKNLNMVENHLFESLPYHVIHKSYYSQDFFVKEKFPKKSYGRRTFRVKKLGLWNLCHESNISEVLCVFFFILVSNISLSFQ